MNDLIKKIAKKQIRTDLPEFRVGDTVRVDAKIVEGERERIQGFEGIVIAIQNADLGKTFTVRKLSDKIGVERTWPINSPLIADITIITKGKVRRAKIGGYLSKSLKKPKIKERN